MTRILEHRAGTESIGPAAAAIGVFDGVHLGHQALVSDAVALAAERGIASCVVTFDRDPDQVVTPEHAAPQLTALEDKIDLLTALGPDVVLVVPFDRQLAALSPEEFVTGVLLDAMEPRVCLVGHDFRFGTRASGDVDTLRALGAHHEFDVVTHGLVRDGEAPITSSRIRAAIAAGDVISAARMLGRPHRLTGTVMRGQGLGHALGTPTANLDVDPRFALPATGVYACHAETRGVRYPAAVSVGVAPSFRDATCLLEAHLIGYEGDLYGASVTVHFVERLREQRAFSDRAALADAIAQDVHRVGEMLS
ncbi:MAG TPA: bifunctional riboflavin kinase/FAD synthetase [Coriobacteriia bacterium]|nr:bifunctional riboflavin kinase/FAD synthetase [Coriobacteriia bacterium]